MRVVAVAAVETRPQSGMRETTTLPDAIKVTFTGATMDDSLAEAASMFCQTVLMARPATPLQPESDFVSANRMM